MSWNFSFEMVLKEIFRLESGLSGLKRVWKKFLGFESEFERWKRFWRRFIGSKYKIRYTEFLQSEKWRGDGAFRGHKKTPLFFGRILRFKIQNSE